MHIKAEEIGKIRNYDQHVEMSETGTVMYVGDGIARVYGVRNAMSMELLEFPGGLMGMVLNLEEDNVGVALLGDDTGIKEGDPVKRTGRIFSVPVGPAVAGRVLWASPSTDWVPWKARKSVPWSSRLPASCSARAFTNPWSRASRPSTPSRPSAAVSVS